MNTRQFLFSLWACLALSVQPSAAQSWAAQAPPYGRPDATIDLRTREGVQLVRGAWRYSDVQIIQVDSKGPGRDLKPSGAPVKTYDYSPHAGMAGFDDAAWQVLDPTTLDVRRGNGKVSFTETHPSIREVVLLRPGPSRKSCARGEQPLVRLVQGWLRRRHGHRFLKTP